MLNPKDRVKKAYHASRMVSFLRMGYCIRIDRGRDVNDHYTHPRMCFVGRCIPYLRWGWRYSMVEFQVLDKGTVWVYERHIVDVDHCCMTVVPLENRSRLEVGEWGDS